MKIAILGTGHMGSRLASGWTRSGHQVIFGSREPSRAMSVAEEVGSGTEVTDYAGAARQGHVVVLAVPYGSVVGLAADLREDLRGRVVMDITNPMRSLLAEVDSGAEKISRAIGTGARVVPAFKHTFDDTLDVPIDPGTGLPRDVFICGDEEQAKEVVSGLIQDLGFRPVDGGPLSGALTLDLLVPLMVEVDSRYERGRTSSWKMLGPKGVA